MTIGSHSGCVDSVRARQTRVQRFACSMAATAEPQKMDHRYGRLHPSAGWCHRTPCYVAQADLQKCSLMLPCPLPLLTSLSICALLQPGAGVQAAPRDNRVQPGTTPTQPACDGALPGRRLTAIPAGQCRPGSLDSGVCQAARRRRSGARSIRDAQSAVGLRARETQSSACVALHPAAHCPPGRCCGR